MRSRMKGRGSKKAVIAQEAYLRPYLTLLQGSPLEILAAPGHAFHTVPVCVDNTHERRRKAATTRMGKGGTTPTGNHHSTVNPVLPTLRSHKAETPALRSPRTARHSDNSKGPQARQSTWSTMEDAKLSTSKLLTDPTFKRTAMHAMDRPCSANGAARDKKSKPKEAEKRRREPSAAKAQG